MPPIPNQPPKNRSLQFGISALFMVMLLIAIFFAMFRNGMDFARHRRSPEEAIKDALKEAASKSDEERSEGE